MDGIKIRKEIGQAKPIDIEFDETLKNTSINFFYHDGTVYTDGFIKLPGNADALYLEDLHFPVFPTPFSGLPENIQSDILSSCLSLNEGISDEYIKHFLRPDIKDTENCWVLIDEKDPERWVGFVCFSAWKIDNEGIAIHSRDIHFEATLDFCFVRPCYRGSHWGPAISAIAGWTVGCMLHNFLDKIEETLRNVSLSVSGEPAHEYSEYLILSFGYPLEIMSSTEWSKRDRVGSDEDKTWFYSMGTQIEW